jgi:hypothetical protein
MATRTRASAAHDADETLPDLGAPDWGVQVGALDDEPPEETAEDRVALMLRDMRDAQNAQVRLYRKNANSKKLAWCADYSPEQFEGGGFDMIRAQWGAGSFEVRVYGKTTGGAFGLIGRSEVEIVAPLVTAAAPASNNSELAQILASMADTNSKLLAKLSEKPDPTVSMKESFALMAMMREAMGLNGAPVTPQRSSIGEIIDAIKELKGAQELIAPATPDADPDNPMTMLPQIVELVKAALQKPAADTMPTIRAPLSIAAAPLPVAPMPAPVATVDDQRFEEQMMLAMKEVLAQLVAKVIAQENTDDVAEWVYEKLPDDLVGVLQGDDWFAMLSMVAPELKPHEAYLTQVREKALAIFAEESSTDASEGHPTP